MKTAYSVISALRLAVFRAAVLALLLDAAVFAQSAPPVYQWTTIAGRASIGLDDGSGAAARFSNPTGLAFDPSGNLYIADTGNHTIRRLTPAGVVSTLAGSPGQSGSVDGIGAAARFNNPEGVAVDGAGNVYVADTGNFTIRKVTPAGVVITYAGQAGRQGTVDGSVASALFNSPQKIVVDSVGTVYVLDSGIRRISAGTVQTIFASGPATLTSPGYAGPVRIFNSALSVDAGRQIFFEGEVWLTQYHIPTSAVLKMDAGGAVSVVSSLPQLPWGENSGLLAIGPAGNLWATEAAWKIHGAREIVVRINTGGSTDDIGVIRDAAGAEEHHAGGLAASSTGELIYTRDDNVIVKMSVDGIQVVLAGTPQGTLDYLRSLAVDSTGNVWAAVTEVGFSDQLYTGENEVATAPVLLKVSRDGTIVTPIRPGFIFACPVTYLAAAVDLSDNVYFAGIRMLTQPLLSRIAPAGSITSAAFSLPKNLAEYYGLGAFVADASGNLFIPDAVNHVVWKRTPDDQWSALAGKEGIAGTDEGTGDSARFGYLSAITADRDGNCYVLDTQFAGFNPDRCVIRRIFAERSSHSCEL
jgi:sugar lactone lactonase YvrE